MPPDPLGLRTSSKWRVISMIPDVCMTPVGAAMVPVPYTIVSHGDTSQNLAADVNMNDSRVFHVESLLQTCQGDEPGIGGGVISHTQMSVCEPIQEVSTVRTNNKPVIRDKMLFWMNSRNTIGVCQFEPPTAAANTSKQSDSSGSNSNGVVSSGTDSGSNQGNKSGGTIDAKSYEQELADTEKYGWYDGNIVNGCKENATAPNEYACSWEHCNNNCIGTRYGASAAASILSFGVEALQFGENYILGRKYTSAWQASDWIDNLKGRLLALDPKNNGVSCQMLCRDADPSKSILSKDRPEMCPDPVTGKVPSNNRLPGPLGGCNGEPPSLLGHIKEGLEAMGKATEECVKATGGIGCFPPIP